MDCISLLKSAVVWSVLLLSCGSPDTTQPSRTLTLGPVSITPNPVSQNGSLSVSTTATGVNVVVDSIVGTFGGVSRVQAGATFDQQFPVTASGTLTVTAHASGVAPQSTSVQVSMQSAALTGTGITPGSVVLGDSVHVTATLTVQHTTADSIVLVYHGQRIQQAGASFDRWLTPDTTGGLGVTITGYAEGAESPTEELGLVVTAPPPAGPLDIVLILTDDQRPETMQYMPRTLSLIAQQGVTFTNAFASTPLCCPSRASILTGLYTHNHGVITNFGPTGGARVFVDTSTIATWLQAAGYRTGLIGKYLNDYNHMQPWPYRPPGWSVWKAFKLPEYYQYTMVEGSQEVVYGSSPADYSTEMLATAAVDFIANTPANQRLLLVYAPYAPHAPALPAVQDDGAFSHLPALRPPSYDEADASDKPLWVQALPRVSQAKSDSNDVFRRRQVESLQAVDRGVERIVSALAAAGRLDSTAIIFASDNGLVWGEHRFFTKNCVYEECIRVPLLIRAPGVVPRQDDHLVELIDLAPTIARWARIDSLPAPVNGLDLAPLLRSAGAPWRTEILLEVLARLQPPATEGLFSAVRTDRYVYSELTTGERELYDLMNDPFQLENIAEDPGMAGVVAQLKALLDPLKSR